MICINENQYYTTAELADKFNVTIQAIYKWRKQGKIKFKQSGPKTFFYLVEDVVKFIEGK